jgi:hypothetical protein
MSYLLAQSRPILIPIVKRDSKACKSGLQELKRHPVDFYIVSTRPKSAYFMGTATVDLAINISGATGIYQDNGA